MSPENPAVDRDDALPAGNDAALFVGGFYDGLFPETSLLCAVRVCVYVEEAVLFV
jgi:hypothetical protein